VGTPSEDERVFPIFQDDDEHTAAERTAARYRKARVSVEAVQAFTFEADGSDQNQLTKKPGR
jgi:hypothetical protein